MAALAAAGADDAGAPFQIDPNRIRHYTDFLDGDYGRGPYRDKVQEMVRRKQTRLIISLDDLRKFDGVLSERDENYVPETNRLIAHPMDHLPAVERALKDFVSSIHADYVKTVERARLEFRVGFEGSFGAHALNPRSLSAAFLGMLVSVEGIVTRCSLVRPKVVRSVHYCEATASFTQRDYRDGTTAGTFGITTSIYPTADEAGNPLVTEYGLSTYRDHQGISIQEMPEKAPAGQLPRSVDVILDEDLVDRIKPGDRVQIVGSYRAMPSKSNGSTSGVFRTVLIANNIRLLSKDASHLAVTDNDVQHIKKVAKNKNVFEVLSRSLAPSIFGQKEVKEAIVLLLLGGVEKDLATGTHIRGDINMMMVGDPSTAKSQLLRFVLNIAPLAVATTGRGATGVGLTAAVTTDKETGERRLEAGAMVLADRGVVCIDEFDKMSDGDRVAMHEVMEQQTVTISKAGIHASLNARCSVVAAANPVYGQYNRQKKPTENIGLPDSLLSRFDLLFIVLDHMNPLHDREISMHVLRMHQFRKPGEEDGAPTVENVESILEDSAGVTDPSGAEADTPVSEKVERVTITTTGVRRERIEVLTFQFLRKYLYYAKTRVRPILSKEAADVITQAYASLRNQEDNKTLPVTARTLETLIRLSTAHAKARLSLTVTDKDAEVAEKIMRFALYNETEVERKPKKKRARVPGDGDDDGDDGGDDDEGGDEAGQPGDGADADGVDGAATPSAPKRARADPFDFQAPAGSGARTPRGRSAAAAAAGVIPPSDASMDTDDGDKPAGPARDAEDPDTPAPPRAVRLSGERVAEFQNALKEAFRAIRRESGTFDEIMAHVNSGRANPFTEAEAEAVLVGLEQQNRIFYRDRNVFLI